MNIRTVCENYFKAFDILFSKNTSENERIIAGFEVASYFTLFIPLMFGITLGIDRLVGRVSINLPATTSNRVSTNPPPPTVNRVAEIAAERMINPDVDDQVLPTETIQLSPEEFIKMLDERTPFPQEKNITIEGDLYLIDRTDLSALPAGLHVRGSLHLAGCNRLTALPVGLRVENVLDLRECTALVAVPVDLSVGDLLHLGGCTGLTAFSAGLHIEGSLNIARCTGLTTLDNLQVGGDLYCIGCTGLTALRENLKVGGDLNLTGCSGLTALPTWITSIGLRQDGEIRIINLSHTGLSDEVMERLQRTPHEGIQFHVTQRAQVPTREFSKLEDAMAFWAQEANAQVTPVVEFSNPVNILTFLARLIETQEYKNPQSRSILAQRVLDAFTVMNNNNDIKQRAELTISIGLESCDDRIISAFDEIELMIRIDEIENKGHPEEKLKELAKGFLLLDMVNERAREHIRSLPFVDEIEVYLAFQIGLADRLSLPISTRGMIFRRCTQITDDQIQEMGNKIEEECTEEKLSIFLETWSPWQSHQRRKGIPEYETLSIAAGRELAEDDICVFTQDKPEKPVLYDDHIYDYEAFIEQYKVNGTDPLTRKKIDLSQLKRVLKARKPA
jgi:hypothetical protein